MTSYIRSYKELFGNSPVVSYFDNESLNHEGLNSLLIVMQIPYLQLALSVMALKIFDSMYEASTYTVPDL